ncbi:MAG: hypothetical protein JW810_02580 [Sedimentisphaerales bacterium]|nr:hypothetical protein [Sedimentisphaerales bacterium]
MANDKRLCDYSCRYAEFARDGYCSDNVTMYCRKAKAMVRKFSPCPLSKKTKKRTAPKAGDPS